MKEVKKLTSKVTMKKMKIIYIYPSLKFLFFRTHFTKASVIKGNGWENALQE